jgi:PAS domain S-box-containing protein
MLNKDVSTAVLRFDHIFRRIPVGIALVDGAGIYEDANPAYCSIFGYSESELIGNKVTLIFPQESWPSKLITDAQAGVYNDPMPQEWTA